MRSIKLMLTGLVTIVIFMTAPIAQAKTYVLPQDLAKPVITLDYQGNRLQRINDAPTLSILANGSVLMPKSYAHSKAYAYQINETELQELLDFIIRENHFFDYDSETVRAKSSTLERQRLPVHFTTTVITVNADNQEKEVRVASLGYGPMVEETKMLLAIKQRLDQLMSVVKLGGIAELDNWVEIANNEFNLKSSASENLIVETQENQKQIGGGSIYGQFRPEDLQSGGQRADGSTYVRFVRRNSTTMTSVTIDITADGERYVTVVHDDI